MKMLFYSSDGPEVELVSQEFKKAEIPCEVRTGPAFNGAAQQPPQAELWIQNDKDCHRAFMLCVQLGIGFAKRAPRRHLFHIDEPEPEPEVEPDTEPEAVRH